MEPLNNSSAAGSGSFPSSVRFKKRNTYSIPPLFEPSVGKNLSMPALAELIRASLRQHRIMGQGDSARDFDLSESMENAGILDVFPIFHTARLVQKIRRSPQLPPKRCCLKSFSILIIKHAMAVPFIAGIRDLVTEFLADALIILGTLQSAGTVSPCFFQALPDRPDHFLIFIQPNCHLTFPPL